jgi:hypothetical protein
MSYRANYPMHPCLGVGLLVLSCILAMPSVSRAADDTASAGMTIEGCRMLPGDKNGRYIFIDFIAIQATCTAQIDAIVDTSDKVCLPDQSSYVHAQQVVVSYIDQRPTRLHERFTKLALEALVTTWPCPR